MMGLVLVDFLGGVLLDNVLIVVSLLWALLSKPKFLMWLLGTAVTVSVVALTHFLGIFKITGLTDDQPFIMDDWFLWVFVAISAALWVGVVMVIKALFLAIRRRMTET